MLVGCVCWGVKGCYRAGAYSDGDAQHQRHDGTFDVSVRMLVMIVGRMASDVHHPGDCFDAGDSMTG